MSRAPASAASRDSERALVWLLHRDYAVKTTDRPAHDAQMRAAAAAAANWVRARRAAWTGTDVGQVLLDGCSLGESGSDAASGAGSILVEPAIVAGPTAFTAATAVEKAPPYMFTLAIHAFTLALHAARMLAEIARSFQLARALKLAWRVSTTLALVASLLALAVLGRQYWKLALQTQTAAKVRAAAAITPRREPIAAISTSTGQLHVTADPAPARVIVDGKPRGVTPLLIENLKVGSHSVVLQNAGGTVEESVSIAAGDTQELSESIYPGWLTLFAPFDVVVSEHGHEIALDEKHQLLLAPGPHDLRLENRTLGYEETRHVEMKPGAVASLSIAPPRSTLTVTSNAPAQVWLDGKLVGDTPVDIPVDLGTHALVVKHANGEQRQQSVTVTAKPLVVDM